MRSRTSGSRCRQNPHRRAQPRRCCLHPQPAHFVQHHDNVARRHQHLFFDFFLFEYLHSRWRILQPRSGPGRVDRDLFFDRRLWLEHQSQLPLARFRNRHRCLPRKEALFHNGDFQDSQWHGENGNPARISCRCSTVHGDLSARGRKQTSPYLNAQRGTRRLAKCGNKNGSEEEKQSHQHCETSRWASE